VNTNLTTKKAGFRLTVDGITFILHKYPRTTFTYKDALGRKRSKVESGWGLISVDGYFHLLRKPDLDLEMTKPNLWHTLLTESYIIAQAKQPELKAKASNEHPEEANMICPKCSRILRKVQRKWAHRYICLVCGYKHY